MSGGWTPPHLSNVRVAFREALNFLGESLARLLLLEFILLERRERLLSFGHYILLLHGRGKDVKLFALVDLIELDLLLKVTKDKGNDDVEDVPVVPEPVVVDEDEDPKEEEFKEEEEPQEKEDDMEVDIEEYENEPELTYPYEEVDPLNPSSPASESELEDVIEVEDMIESKDETVLASVHEVDDCVVARWGMRWSKRKEKQRTSIMLGNAEEKAECKKLKKELEEARIMPPKSAPLTQASSRRMIKESVDAAIIAERARHANAKNDARGLGPVRGQDVAPFVQGEKVKFSATTLQGPALTWWNAKVATMGLETVNHMP
nr:hypothetical protein [Tanacetum cinerariifolium]